MCSVAVVAAVLSGPPAAAQVAVPGQVDDSYSYGRFFNPASNSTVTPRLVVPWADGTLVYAPNARFDLAGQTTSGSDPFRSGLFRLGPDGKPVPANSFDLNTPFAGDPERSINQFDPDEAHELPDGSMLLVHYGSAGGRATGGSNTFLRLSQDGIISSVTFAGAPGFPPLQNPETVNAVAFDDTQRGSLAMYVSRGFREASSGTRSDRDKAESASTQNMLTKWVYTRDGVFQQDADFCPWFITGSGCTPVVGSSNYNRTDLQAPTGSGLGSMAVLPDGSLVVGGIPRTNKREAGLPVRQGCERLSGAGLLRLNPDGSLHRDWGRCASNSVVHQMVGSVADLSVGSDSAGNPLIFAAGSFRSYDSEDRPGIMAVRPNGYLSTAFNPRGASFGNLLSATADGSVRHRIQGLSGGQLLVGRGFESDGPRLVRLNSQGVVDQTFMGPEGAGLNSGRAVVNIWPLKDDKVMVTAPGLTQVTSGVDLNATSVHDYVVLDAVDRLGSPVGTDGRLRPSDIIATAPELVGSGTLRRGVDRTVEVSFEGDLDSYPPQPETITSRTLFSGPVAGLGAECPKDSPVSVDSAQRTTRASFTAPRDPSATFVCVTQQIVTSYGNTSEASSYFELEVPVANVPAPIAGQLDRERSPMNQLSAPYLAGGDGPALASYRSSDDSKYGTPEGYTNNFVTNRVGRGRLAVKMPLSPSDLSMSGTITDRKLLSWDFVGIPPYDGVSDGSAACSAAAQYPDHPRFSDNRRIRVRNLFEGDGDVDPLAPRTVYVEPNTGLTSFSTSWTCLAQQVSVRFENGIEKTFTSKPSIVFVDEGPGKRWGVPRDVPMSETFQLPKPTFRNGFQEASSIRPGATATVGASGLKMYGTSFGSNRTVLQRTPGAGQPSLSDRSLVIGTAKTRGGPCVETSLAANPLRPGTTSTTGRLGYRTRMSSVISAPPSSPTVKFVCAYQTISAGTFDITGPTAYVPIGKEQQQSLSTIGGKNDSGKSKKR